MSGDCCGSDPDDDDNAVSHRTVWIILGVGMLLGWGTLAGVLLSR
jgi:hypothetical protein